MKYIWQKSDWPHFEYDLEAIQETLYLYARAVGEISGKFQHIQKNDQKNALLDIIVAEALKTSEIEGEYYDRADVRSSLRNQLGLSNKVEKVKDRRAESISKLVVHTRETFDAVLTPECLFGWHKILMEAHSHIDAQQIGSWRKGEEPMQIISGAYGHEKIHYEAPPSKSVPKEMDRFISWFNQTRPSDGKIKLPGPVRASIAHLYFECIHPFEDGNGRIGRVLSEKALSQDMGRPVLLSLSNEIMKKKRDYYDQLSKASKGGGDITQWITYFVSLIYEAQLSTQELVEFVLFKSKLWREKADTLNERQKKVLQRMLKEGPKGFEGGMSASKYIKLTGASKATATRDLADLLEKGCLVKSDSGGRSTRYDLPSFKA